MSRFIRLTRSHWSMVMSRNLPTTISPVTRHAESSRPNRSSVCATSELVAVGRAEVDIGDRQDRGTQCLQLGDLLAEGNLDADHRVGLVGSLECDVEAASGQRPRHRGTDVATGHRDQCNGPGVVHHADPGTPDPGTPESRRASESSSHPAVTWRARWCGRRSRCAGRTVPSRTVRVNSASPVALAASISGRSRVACVGRRPHGEAQQVERVRGDDLEAVVGADQSAQVLGHRDVAADHRLERLDAVEAQRRTTA